MSIHFFKELHGDNKVCVPLCVFFHKEVVLQRERGDILLGAERMFPYFPF